MGSRLRGSEEEKNRIGSGLLGSEEEKNRIGSRLRGSEEYAVTTMPHARVGGHPSGNERRGTTLRRAPCSQCGLLPVDDDADSGVFLKAQIIRSLITM